MQAGAWERRLSTECRPPSLSCCPSEKRLSWFHLHTVQTSCAATGWPLLPPSLVPQFIGPAHRLYDIYPSLIHLTDIY